MIKIDATSKTKKYVGMIQDGFERIDHHLDNQDVQLEQIQNKLEDLTLKLENTSSSSLLELKQLLVEQKQDLDANINVSQDQLEQKLNLLL